MVKLVGYYDEDKDKLIGKVAYPITFADINKAFADIKKFRGLQNHANNAMTRIFEDTETGEKFFIEFIDNVDGVLMLHEEFTLKHL